jgi:four helix bundle protein
MDAAGAVDAQNAPTAPWKTAQNAVSHSAHTRHQFLGGRKNKPPPSTRSTHEIPDSPAAASGPSNIAEAFGHYRHKESARYARIAKASLTETLNHLGDGVDRRFWTTTQAAPLLTIAKRAIGATIGWIRYLESTATPPAYWEQQKNRKRTRTERKGSQG